MIDLGFYRNGFISAQQNRTERNGTERNGTERNETKRNGMERNGTEKNRTKKTEKVYLFVFQKTKCNQNDSIINDTCGVYYSTKILF